MLTLDDVRLAACRRVLNLYCDVLSVSSIETAQLSSQGGGFSGALVVRVEIAPHRLAPHRTAPNHGESDALPPSVWCLRRWPKDALPLARLRELHRWLRFLHAESLPVAVPLATRDGSTLLESDGTLWQLEPWLPGAGDFHAHPSDERLRHIMQTLARVHLAASRYSCSPTGQEWFAVRRMPSPTVWERLTLLEELTPQRISALRQSLERLREPSGVVRLLHELLHLGLVAIPDALARLRPLLPVEFPCFPCWRDLWHDHVLLDAGHVTGLIDASATRCDSPAVDLARLLGSLLGHDSVRWEQAFQFYSDVRPLSVDEQRLARALDTSGVLLSGITWIRRCLDHPQGMLNPAVESRIATLADRLRYGLGLSALPNPNPATTPVEHWPVR